MKYQANKPAHLLAGSLLLSGSVWLISSHVERGIDLSDLLVENAHATVDSICDCSGDDTLICHLHRKKHGGDGDSKDSDGDQHTIRVGEAAVPAHLAHGDTLGPCPGDTEASVEVHTDRPCICADGSPGNLVDDPPESMKVFRQMRGQ